MWVGGRRGVEGGGAKRTQEEQEKLEKEREEREVCGRHSVFVCGRGRVSMEQEDFTIPALDFA